MSDYGFNLSGDTQLALADFDAPIDLPDTEFQTTDNAFAGTVPLEDLSFADTSFSNIAFDGGAFDGGAFLDDSNLAFDLPQASGTAFGGFDGDELAQVSGQGSGTGGVPVYSQPGSTPAYTQPSGSGQPSTTQSPQPLDRSAPAGVPSGVGGASFGVLEGVDGIFDFGATQQSNADFQELTPEIEQALQENPGEGVLLRRSVTEHNSTWGHNESYNSGSLGIVGTGGSPADALNGQQEILPPNTRLEHVFIDPNAGNVDYANWGQPEPSNLDVFSPDQLDALGDQGWPGILNNR